MIPKITTPIEKQNFQIVGEQIGAILFIELENQKELQGFSDPINVYSERTAGFGIEDQIYINVSLSSASYGNKTQKDSQGNTLFYVDLFSNGKESEMNEGYSDSANRIQKFLGMVRFILSHTDYKTLGFPLGFIGGTYFESFEFTEANYMQQDAVFTKMCRAAFSVRIQESQTMSPTSVLEDSETKVKLHSTDLGYIYKFTN